MDNKRNHIIFIFVMVAACVTGIAITRKNFVKEAKNMESFTFDRTSSYDEKYYAVSTQKQGNDNIVVSIYETKDDVPVFSFETVRTFDFWGICWENSSYNIWIQSGDIGVICYSYENNKWNLNKNAQRPNNIISKYDSCD